jgi:hypothetical protein
VGGAAPPRAQPVQRGRDAGARAAAPDAHARAVRRLRREPGACVSTCLVSVARNRYSVPCELAGSRSARGCTRPGGGRGRRPWWPATSA